MSISWRACTDCEPVASQPAPESAFSTRGARKPSPSATTAQPIRTTEVGRRVAAEPADSGRARSSDALVRSPPGRRRSSARTALEDQRGRTGSDHHVEPLVDADEGGQQQEPGRDEQQRARRSTESRCPASANSTRSSGQRERTSSEYISAAAFEQGAELSSCAAEPAADLLAEREDHRVGDRVDGEVALLAATDDP